MKQFERMRWIRQGFLGLVMCAVMLPSHAMSVRERYLLQHPQAAEPQDVAVPAQVVKHKKIYRAVKKQPPIHQKISQHRHQKIEQPIAKHSHGQTAKHRHQRVLVAKHTPSKFDKQQARDADAALNQRRATVKKTPIVKPHVKNASKTKLSVTKPTQKHHRKHHRAK